MPRIALPAILACLIAASSAQAAPVSVSADDARDSTKSASTDIERVRTTYDADAGSWSLTVRFYAPVSDTDWAMINASFTQVTSGADPCSQNATQFAFMRASTKPSSTTVYGTVGTTPTKSVSDDRREVTLAAQGTPLGGHTPGCVTVTLSYESSVVDTLDGGAPFPAPAPPPPPPGTTPPPPGGGGTPTPSLAIRLASSSHVISARRPRIRLRALSSAVSGRVRAVSHGRTLAVAAWKAAADRPVTIVLRLTKAGRRALRHHRKIAVRVTITARSDGANPASRAFRMTLRT